MVSLSPTSVNIQTIVLGNILAITPEDTLQLVIIGVVSLAVLLAKWKDLMVVFFDESHARSIGLNPTLLKIVFFTLLAACTVAALQTVGAFLVIAMVVTPGATAYLLTDRFPRLIALSVAIGAVTSFVGAYVSYFLDGATGGVIVVLQTLIFLARLLLRARSTACSPRGAAPREALEARAMIETLLLPFQFAFMQQRDRHRGAGRGADGAALVLPRAQGLVADGRRGLATPCCPASCSPISPASRSPSAPSPPA